MMLDIVVPDGNEDKFLVMGEKLGYEVVFLYKKDTKIKKGKRAILVKNANEINKFLGKYDYIVASGDQWAFSDKRVDFAVDLEAGSKDFMHHRGSGLNDFLAKEAKKNDVSLLFNFNLLLNNDGVILGRMSQNVMIGRKYKVKMKIASLATTPYEMRAGKDMQALGTVLGMHSSEAKKALR